MAYKVFWQIPHRTLCMELAGPLSLDDFNQINHAVMSQLNDAGDNANIALLINAVRVASVSQTFQQLRTSQRYVEHPALKHIYIVTGNKLVRLIMLLAFNLCKPTLRFFDDLTVANAFLRVMQPNFPTSSTAG